MLSIKLYLPLIILFALTACQGQSSTSTATESSSTATSSAKEKMIYERLSNAEFRALLESDEDIVLLDVRTPAETARGVIATARQIDYQAADFKDQIAALDRDKTYLVYCQSGGRSARAANLMQELGFPTIYELKNGYSRWE